MYMIRGNDDVIRYITEFLVSCDNCDKLDIIPHKCCICSKKYCNVCKTNAFKLDHFDVVSFTHSTYCSSCYYELYLNT